MLKHPHHALLKLLSITFVLFLFGLLPWVDNYSHLFGFVFGFLLSYAFLPFVSFGPYERQKKVALIWVCLVSAGVLFICLVLLFYIIPVYDCEICSYFNCLPITRDFCASQNIDFKREEPVVWHMVLRLSTVIIFVVLFLIFINNIIYFVYLVFIGFYQFIFNFYLLFYYSKATLYVCYWNDQSINLCHNSIYY